MRETMHIRPFLPAFFAAFSTVLCAVGASRASALPSRSMEKQDSLVARVEAALEHGRVATAESLFNPALAEPYHHRTEILRARLAASRGDWKHTETCLQAWESAPARREGSGEILFWRGWAALHQGATARADSLFVLSSAYPGEPRSQEALEYRFAALLDPGPALQAYLRGLPESPLPAPLRAASLEAVPVESRLYPHAQWHLVRLLEIQGDSARALAILTALSREPSDLNGQRARARLAFLREHDPSDSALTLYEVLLLRQQQGILSEFARKRAGVLRNAPDAPQKNP